MEGYIVHVTQLSNIPDYSTSLLTTVQDYCLTCVYVCVRSLSSSCVGVCVFDCELEHTLHLLPPLATN